MRHPSIIEHSCRQKLRVTLLDPRRRRHTIKKKYYKPRNGAFISPAPEKSTTTLLALSLVIVIWNLPPYYHNLISTAPPLSPSIQPHQIRTNAFSNRSETRRRYSSSRELTAAVHHPSPSSDSPPNRSIPSESHGSSASIHLVVNCTFPSNPNAYYDQSPNLFERFHGPRGVRGNARFSPPYPYEYLYCGSSLYGNVSSSRMRE
ncbi:hypothetical protein Bca4012_017638 [Brassica carinata]